MVPAAWGSGLAGILLALTSAHVSAQALSTHGAAEYSRSSTELDINGRTVSLRFGAVAAGLSAQGPLATRVSASYGQGYDPTVAASFLSINASGPARSSMLALGVSSPSLVIGPISWAFGLSYRQQSVNVAMKGTDGEDPFSGRFNLRLRGLTPSIQGEALLPLGVQATARLGYQRWDIHYEAFGELGRVRIRTESTAAAWGPDLSMRLAKMVGPLTWSVQGSAYRLDADNRVWMPGIRIGASLPY